MAFKAADLAVRLGPFNEVADNGYKLLIACGPISATDQDGCSGTNPDVLLEGRIDIQDNLIKLQNALQQAVAHVAGLMAQPAPPQPNPPQPNAPQPTA